MKLLITIDTECDNAWSKPHDVTTENAKYLPRFQSLCETYGFKPTYLVAYEMAKDEFFVEFAIDVLKKHTGEIGSHLHAWYSPPEYNLTSDDMQFHPYLLEYPEEIIRKKVKFLTELLEDTFGRKMYSHRAGRWGLNATYARILVENQYLVDCSVTPHKKWDAVLRPSSEPPCPDIDYTYFPDEPYFLDAEDISKHGKLPVLEIPVTLIPSYNRPLSSVYSLFSEGNVRRGIRFLFGRPVKWFRPHRIYKELMEVAKRRVRDDSDYIMFMLHSSEFMPGGSPNFRTIKDINQMYDEVEEAFQYLADNGAKGLTCYEYYQDFTSFMGKNTIINKHRINY